jgi:hypothetical protein
MQSKWRHFYREEMHYCITLMKVEKYNLCLDVARSLPMALCFNTHTFAPMLLMKSIHNLTWKAKAKISQAQSST